MPATISLSLNRTAFAPGEPVRPLLIVSNASETPLDVPLLDGHGHPRILLRLTIPGSDRGVEFLLPDDEGRPPEPDADRHETLQPESDRSRAVRLDRTQHVRTPGEYRLQAILDPDGTCATSNKLTWYQEGACALDVTIPLHRGRLEVDRCYYILKGERLSDLFRAHLRWDQELRPGHMDVVSTEHVASVGAGARSLVAMAGQEPSVAIGDQWLAWLDADGLHAALQVLGFQEMTCELPFEAERIVREVIPVSDGGCGVLVTSADRRSVAFVRFERPDQEVALKRFVAEEGDAQPPPALPDSRLMWVHSFSTPFQGCALATGVGQHHGLRGLAVTVETDEGLEIRYGTFEGDGPPGRFGSILAGEGWALRGCDPALGLDSSGRSHIALLLRSRAISGKDRKVFVVRTSFDIDANPRLDRDTIFLEGAPMPEEPVAGAVSLLSSDTGGPWTIAWSVLLDDNLLLAGRRSGEAHMLAPEALIAQPMGLLTFPERSFVAGLGTDGTLSFVDLESAT